MTLYLIDLADPYQAGINLAAIKRAGFTAVNIKVSQGMGYVNPRLRQWINEAHANDLQIGAFHWLDNSGSGAAQAARVLTLLRANGIADDCAFQTDCESTATWQILHDFVTAMQDGLGRPTALYTGDWWAASHGASWRPNALTPYLWAPANQGYLGSYPGDSSSAWNAGYWGYGHLSLLQYAVGPVTGSGVEKVSKTAVRDAAVWAALTGKGTEMPLTATDTKTLWEGDILARPSTAPVDTAEAKANTTWTPENMLRSTWDHAHLADKKLDTVTAQLAGLSAAVQTLAQSQGMDPAQVLAAVQAGAEKAVQDALAHGADTAAAGQ